ncbi:hypothetical protein PYW08_001808 [Mythimna loreyi]|uniref:Uncharacterized protein n=1 Tax=Mythimna loreyi TaxID=667449 RepID=A0ACC2R5W8_9NEOP|nr:hypothetical protein PYW08_001808 [Mythimna loreyi]
MASITSVCFAMALLIVACEAKPNAKFDLKIPDECKGKGFCNIKPEGYDDIQDLIDSLLTPTFLATNMGDRIGEPEHFEELSPKEDWHNCPYKKTIESSPYAYSHSDDTEADIIVQSKLFRQPIESITCAHDKISKEDRNASTECFQHLDLKSFNMKSTCETSYAARSIIVLDKKTGQLMKKPYVIPCCCTCKIERP